MEARYDNMTITLTPRFIVALEELGRAELEMMREQDSFCPDCWTWCKITVGDLSNQEALAFECGGDEDRLPEMEGLDVLVISSTHIPDYPPGALMV